jgi:BMFP domain-containing protein YqiC
LPAAFFRLRFYRVASIAGDARPRFCFPCVIALNSRLVTALRCRENSRMLNRDSLDQLAQQIGNLFGQNTVPQDIQRNLRALIQSGLAKMDVVTRDEFAAQAAILESTRSKLDTLEKQLAELTRQLGDTNSQP